MEFWQNNESLKKMLPLFGSPVIKQTKLEAKTKKYELQLKNSGVNLKKGNENIFTRILKFYVKTITSYGKNVSILQQQDINNNNHSNFITDLKNKKLIKSSNENTDTTNVEINSSIQSPNVSNIQQFVDLMTKMNLNRREGARKNIFNEMYRNCNLGLNNQIDNLSGNNKLKIHHTMNSIINKNESFNKNIHTVPAINDIIPVTLKKAIFNKNYTEDSKPLININKFIRSISQFNPTVKGIAIRYNKIIGYNFNSTTTYSPQIDALNYTQSKYRPEGIGQSLGQRLGETNKFKKNVFEFLKSSFYSMHCLISKPIFVITPDKITIQLFYFILIPNLFKFKFLKKNKFLNRFRSVRKNSRNKIKSTLFTNKNRFYKSKFRYLNEYQRLNYHRLSNLQRTVFRKLNYANLISLYPNRFKKMCVALSQFFKKSVELDLIRVHYPYHDSYILASFIGLLINTVKLRVIFRKLFKKAIIKNPNKTSIKQGRKNLYNLPTFLSGIKIRVAGHLLTAKSRPRKTVKKFQRGATAIKNVNFQDFSQIAGKNKKGSFCITISSGQHFRNK